jgi:glycosyltransferase involved in cell wall biosynthesis
MSARRITIGLTYYAPYVSGLTNVARDVAEGLVRSGWHVDVIATRHDPSLPEMDVINGVRIRRVPSLFSIGKGTVAPGYLRALLKSARGSSVTLLNLPMLEAWPAAWLSKRIGTPVVSIYQCDVSLGGSIIGDLQERVMDASTRGCFANTAQIVVSSLDYARASRLSAFMTDPTAVSPPCWSRPRGAPKFRETDELHVGFLGRFTAEKGIDILLQAFASINSPGARLILAGNFHSIAGNSVINEVRPLIEADTRVRVLGEIPDSDIADFYESIDVLALPSTNSLEAFGITQVEAMLAGVPVAASNLPGVRTPIQTTGYGLLVEPKSVESLAEALVQAAEIEIPREDDNLARTHFSGYESVRQLEAILTRVIAEAVT